MNVKKVIEPEARDALKEMLADDQLDPAVSKRVRALLRDLKANNMELTMLDLAQLSRAVMGTEEPAGQHDEYPASVVITSEDGETLVGICDGPEPGGSCPWADQDGHLPCGGWWISTHGWQFKVAEDSVEVCPLAVLLAQAI